MGAIARDATAKEAGSDKCEYPERCANARECMVREILGDLATLARSDVLSERRLPCQYRLCSPCADELAERENEAVRGAWRRLPDILGLSALGLDMEMCTYGRCSQYPARPCSPDGRMIGPYASSYAFGAHVRGRQPISPQAVSASSPAPYFGVV
ncbi:hypothetical protein C8Q79DRAFT_946026 [Trametes meyenii]|nr:hypothetical protein C8Q79DRAFT_946026 [Trametes meyenii]